MRRRAALDQSTAGPVSAVTNRNVHASVAEADTS